MSAVSEESVGAIHGPNASTGGRGIVRKGWKELSARNQRRVEDKKRGRRPPPRPAPLLLSQFSQGELTMRDSIPSISD